ncbi:MAG: IPT/TIG domain-containing protein [Gemmatimonadaceae bacterium]
MASPFGPRPSVASVLPNIGSTGGATPVKIVGARFEGGARVQFGGMPVRGFVDSRDPAGTILYAIAPAHDAGTVDVVVINPGGYAASLLGGYTYASPQSFDFNGDWTGFGNAGQDIPIGFTIRNNQVISAFCDTYATVTFATPPSVINGEFSYAGDDGVTVSGRIVSGTYAVGAMNLAPCTDTNWGAYRIEGTAATAGLRGSRGARSPH